MSIGDLSVLRAVILMERDCNVLCNAVGGVASDHDINRFTISTLYLLSGRIITRSGLKPEHCQRKKKHL